MDLIVGGGISICASLLLWFFLPRGAALTCRELKINKSNEHPWQTSPDHHRLQQVAVVDQNISLRRIKNETAIPVRILKVSIRGLETWNDITGTFEDIDVTSEVLLIYTEGFGDAPDAYLAIVNPGETFSVLVAYNETMTIQYRRAGWSGLLERRRLSIIGDVWV